MGPELTNAKLGRRTNAGPSEETGREIFPYPSGKASEQISKVVDVNPHYITDAQRIRHQAPEVFDAHSRGREFGQTGRRRAHP